MSKHNVKVVEEYLRLMAASYAGAAPVHYDLLWPDAVVTIPGSTPVSGVIEGVENLRAVSGSLKHVIDQETGIKILVEKIIAEDDTVVVLARGRGEATTGRPYNNVYCMWFELEGGLIRSIMEFCDLDYAIWSILSGNSTSDQDK